MRWRALILILSFCAGLLIGCKPKRIDVDPKRFEPVHRATYVYQRFDDGRVAVVAKTPKDLDLALDEIGCATEYVCLITPVGDYFEVTQQRKK